MKAQQHTRLIILTATIFCLFLTPAFGQQGGAKKKEYTFRGKVEKIDAKAKTLTINGEEVKGWMASMTMDYAADKDDIFTKIKVGDTITAKVYEDDYKILHDIQIVPAPKPASETPKK